MLIILIRIRILTKEAPARQQCTWEMARKELGKDKGKINAPLPLDFDFLTNSSTMRGGNYFGHDRKGTRSCSFCLDSLTCIKLLTVTRTLRFVQTDRQLGDGTTAQFIRARALFIRP